MRLESHYLRISPVDELGRPWSCRPSGPISRLTSIYPRISSDFTCVCLRHTDTVATTYRQQHGLKEDGPEIWLNAQAITSSGTPIPSNSRVASASKCREKSTSPPLIKRCRAKRICLHYHISRSKDSLVFDFTCTLTAAVTVYPSLPSCLARYVVIILIDLVHVQSLSKERKTR
jgi:hypothetical protein